VNAAISRNVSTVKNSITKWLIGKEPKKNSSQGRGFKRTSSDRGRRRDYGSNEVTLKVSDQAVLSIRDTTHVVQY